MVSGLLLIKVVDPVTYAEKENQNNSYTKIFRR